MLASNVKEQWQKQGLVHRVARNKFRHQFQLGLDHTSLRLKEDQTRISVNVGMLNNFCETNVGINSSWVWTSQVPRPSCEPSELGNLTRSGPHIRSLGLKEDQTRMSVNVGILNNFSLS